jgi:hypothetical protein
MSIIIPAGTQIHIKIVPTHDLYIKLGYTLAGITMYVAYDHYIGDVLVIPQNTIIIGDFITTANTVVFNAYTMVLNGVTYVISAAGTPIYSYANFSSSDIGLNTNVLDNVIYTYKGTNQYTRSAYFTSVLITAKGNQQLAHTELVLRDTNPDLSFFNIDTYDIPIIFNLDVTA